MNCHCTYDAENKSLSDPEYVLMFYRVRTVQHLVLFYSMIQFAAQQ